MELVDAMAPLPVTAVLKTARRVGVLALALLLLGCGGELAPLPEPVPAAPVNIAQLPPIELPRDHRPHQDLSEWWYFTGHLQDDDGAWFGFEFVIFGANRAALGSTFASHLALSEPGSGSFRFAQRTSTAHGASVDGEAVICVGGWTLALGADSFKVRADSEDLGLELDLQPLNPAVLHGDRGLIDFGPAGWSYYYSHTRLAASGEITLGGRTRQVRGQAWFDHQWGNFLVTGQGGWDWFSLQLDDGRDLMATILRDPDGVATARYGTLVDGDGAARHLDAAAIEIATRDRWISPHSGAEYPAGWRLSVPGDDLDLEIWPAIPDQELDTRASTGTIYWEGAVDVYGGGRPQGRGFVELTGYARNAIASPPETFIGQNLCGPSP